MLRLDLIHCLTEELLELVSLIFVDVGTKRPDQCKCNVVHDWLRRGVDFIFVL
jgi:hypothetical protein